VLVCQGGTIKLVMLLILESTALIASTALWTYSFVKIRAGVRRGQSRNLYTPASHSDQLPSISVCIPARNESDALTLCLERVIASSYPKLEIIVFDDQSKDTTSFVIKSFAHAGVRFVKGAPIDESWLGKNHALESLSRQASGSYIIFLDVDTRIEPDSLSQLVAYIHQSGAKMVSVLPQRADGWRASVWLSTLRYYWELLFARSVAPPCSSSLWAIHRQTLLDDFDSFQNMKQIVQPETKFAQALASTSEYRYVISDRLLGVAFEKKLPSQHETATRLLWPRFGANNRGLMLGVALILTLLWPFAGLFVYSVTNSYVWALALLPAALIALSTYISYARAMWVHAWPLAAIMLPVVLLQELILLIKSAYGYATHSITWKGRKI